MENRLIPNVLHLKSANCFLKIRLSIFFKQAVLNILNEEPPRLKKEDGWDESFSEFIEACL